jgi:hypothetical protein
MVMIRWRREEEEEEEEEESRRRRRTQKMVMMRWWRRMKGENSIQANAVIRPEATNAERVC